MYSALITSSTSVQNTSWNDLTNLLFIPAGWHLHDTHVMIMTLCSLTSRFSLNVGMALVDGYKVAYVYRLQTLHSDTPFYLHNGSQMTLHEMYP